MYFLHSLYAVCKKNFVFAGFLIMLIVAFGVGLSFNFPSISLIPFQELSGKFADLTNEIDRSREAIKHLEKSCFEQLNEMQACRNDSDHVKTSNDVR